MGPGTSSRVWIRHLALNAMAPEGVDRHSRHLGEGERNRRRPRITLPLAPSRPGHKLADLLGLSAGKACRPRCPCPAQRLDLRPGAGEERRPGPGHAQGPRGLGDDQLNQRRRGGATELVGGVPQRQPPGAPELPAAGGATVPAAAPTPGGRGMTAMQELDMARYRSPPAPHRGQRRRQDLHHRRALPAPGAGRRCEAGRDLDLRDILVVTFTEAATEELRERIRGRLRAAARPSRWVLPTATTRCSRPCSPGATTTPPAPSGCGRCSPGWTRPRSPPSTAFATAPFGRTPSTAARPSAPSWSPTKPISRRPSSRTSGVGASIPAEEPYARWVRSRWRTPGPARRAAGELDSRPWPSSPSPTAPPGTVWNRPSPLPPGRPPGNGAARRGGLRADREAVAAKRLSAAKDKGYAAERLATLCPGWEEWFAAHLPFPRASSCSPTKSSRKSVLARAAKKAGEDARPLPVRCLQPGTGTRRVPGPAPAHRGPPRRAPRPARRARRRASGRISFSPSTTCSPPWPTP
ncbi:MAG: UvrD-helicase domain-containing protein [Arhodomonas sp.]|nr:UvrD-helicase domain-containing protein [Arhodomonas sp.]